MVLQPLFALFDSLYWTYCHQYRLARDEVWFQQTFVPIIGVVLWTHFRGYPGAIIPMSFWAITWWFLHPSDNNVNRGDIIRRFIYLWLLFFRCLLELFSFVRYLWHCERWHLSSLSYRFCFCFQFLQVRWQISLGKETEDTDGRTKEDDRRRDRCLLSPTSLPSTLT